MLCNINARERNVETPLLPESDAAFKQEVGGKSRRLADLVWYVAACEFRIQKLHVTEGNELQRMKAFYWYSWDGANLCIFDVLAGLRLRCDERRVLKTREEIV